MYMGRYIRERNKELKKSEKEKNSLSLSLSWMLQAWSFSRNRYVRWSLHCLSRSTLCLCATFIPSVCLNTPRCLSSALSYLQLSSCSKVFAIKVVEHTNTENLVPGSIQPAPRVVRNFSRALQAPISLSSTDFSGRRTRSNSSNFDASTKLASNLIFSLNKLT